MEKWPGKCYNSIKMADILDYEGYNMATVNTLIELLKRKADPMSLSEIRAALLEQVPERTLRRWLEQLVVMSKVQTLGQSRARRYQWIEVEVLSTHPSFFSEHSRKSLQQVERPIFEREPCSYYEAWIREYIPNQDFYLSTFERDKLSENGMLLLADPSLQTYTRKIFDRLLIDLSYNSSRLEGNTYSLLETQQLILQGKTAQEKLDVEKVMILNHKEAIQFLVSGIGRLDINVESIQTMHYLLADGLVLANDSGQIRDEAVRISLSTYLPLEGSNRILDSLNHIVEKAQKIQDPFEQSFFLLVHIAYLQPFIDVNKRTARLCANIPLIKNHLIPLSFNDMPKEEYISAMIAIYELKDIRLLAELYVWSYLRTCQQYQTITTSIGIDVIHVRYRQLQKQLLATIIGNKLVGLALTEAILQFAEASIAKEDQEAFIKDTQYQIAHLENYKILGMGISMQEFLVWKKAMDKEK